MNAAERPSSGQRNLLSIVIPARNEAENLPETVGHLVVALECAAIDHEIIVVDDHSDDQTPAVLAELSRRYPQLRPVENRGLAGFGLAVRAGLAAIRGDAVVIVMADGSDSPDDVVLFWAELGKGYDCVFGSRFIRGGRTIGYPAHKLVLNRLANTFIRLLFGLRYNDVTNAFKCYRRAVIDGVQPILSHHFNLTVELPLKAIIRGYRYSVVPNTWRNRKHGISKLRIREMGSRYMFIVLYCLIERLLSRGDYRRSAAIESVPPSKRRPAARSET